MINEQETIKRLNLLSSSRQFVMHETGTDGSADVLVKKQIPSKNGIYWIAGQTILKNGKDIDSVFRVDTDSGGTLLSVFWKIGGYWYDQQDSDVLTALGDFGKNIFPYEWRYSVPLEEDIFRH